ncbi:MAG: helix-turn-helix transcriptional regulator [Burkholderiaceae bacterium]|nr:helix-turn-helix transcriptional regulator [Burkholderiaceae bacterium]
MRQAISTEKQLGQLLLGLRKSQGLTQAQLAQQAGISQARLSVLELNPGRITVERLMRLLGVLGLELVVQEKGASAEASSSAQSEW